ncbi:hypothetical protein [Sorangium sp. So ce341]|uniref:hypothetical protein n=1 Tax=Sorangium sp. So ce341 TaxID=3133302 RepID=UPI003F5EA61C
MFDLLWKLCIDPTQVGAQVDAQIDAQIDDGACGRRALPAASAAMAHRAWRGTPARRYGASRRRRQRAARGFIIKFSKAILLNNVNDHEDH